MTGLSIEDAGKESYIDKAPRRPEINQARRQTAASKKSPAATSGPAAEKQHGAGEELDAPQQQTKANKSLATSGPEAEKQHGAGEKLDAPQQQTKANKSPATSGLGAEKQCEVDHEEDYSEMAKNFSKIAEKVKKAIPRRYSYDTLPTIYVVPRDLAEGTKDPYEPEVVCIGPLFNQKERRKTKPRHKLESYKWCCLRKLLVNAGVGGGDGCWIPEVHGGLLRKCLDTMRDLEPQIHVSYGDDDISSLVGRSDTLALMMLLDGSFLLHCLMVEYARTKRQAGNSDDDDGKKEDVDDDDDNDDWTQVVGRCGTWEIVTRDLLLLKNQIPFFVLQKLFEHLISRSRASDDSEDYILVKGGLSLFSSLHPGPAAGISSTITCRKVHHLLHLFYLSAIAPTPTNKSSMPRRRRRPRRSQDDDDDDAVPWVRCAKELEHVGVSFKAKKHKQQKWNIFKTTTTTTPFFFHDVSFRHCCGGVLEIPPLELYDYSEALFRNLIAFEQTYLHTRGVVTAYALFMDCLIKTPEDVRLLHSSGVLVSRMNGDRDAAVTGFFSRVCAQAHIFPDQNYLDDVMRDVAAYQSTKRREWRAVLVRDYFVNPWVTTSLIAAFLVLLMTFLQTFFTVYPYYKPHESN